RRRWQGGGGKVRAGEGAGSRRRPDRLASPSVLGLVANSAQPVQARARGPCWRRRLTRLSPVESAAVKEGVAAEALLHGLMRAGVHFWKPSPSTLVCTCPALVARTPASRLRGPSGYHVAHSDTMPPITQAA